MTKREAIRVFKNIHAEAEDPEEKLTAIQDVIDLDSHRSISKDDAIEALRWLVEEYI